jgi:hypothetical protein
MFLESLKKRETIIITQFRRLPVPVNLQVTAHPLEQGLQ